MKKLLLGLFLLSTAPVYASGPATLYWTIPAFNTDGTVLTNLKGYKIYYSHNASNLWKMLNVTDITETSLQINNLGKGTWYFGIRAYNTAGNKSDLSNIVSKVIL